MDTDEVELSTPRAARIALPLRSQQQQQQQHVPNPLRFDSFARAGPSSTAGTVGSTVGNNGSAAGTVDGEGEQVRNTEQANVASRRQM